MSTVDSQSRVDNAYNWLVDEITGFRLKSGAPLSENKLAQQLGISRTPVREALQRLEKEGLVRRTDSARFAVSSISRSEVEEACDLLILLDTYLFERAALNLTPTQIEIITDAVERMEKAAAESDRGSWAESDLVFHRTVNQAANNALVSDTVKQTRRRIQRFWLQSAIGKDRLATCSSEHRVLAQAMITQDLATIGPAVEEHVNHMRASMLDLVSSIEALFGA